ncbi:MAG: alpha/beta fold hydrolase [Gammaproteobacteria bacterium]|nr:MAG: alpha/beta fold hydrolase [Gammaproteobacteria bacterium]
MHTDLPPFSPPVGLRNAHLQSMLNSLGPRPWQVARRSAAMTARSQPLVLNGWHGDQPVKLLAHFDQVDRSNERLVILLHGWEGSAQSTYLLSAASHLYHQGFNILRINLRDHGESFHLNDSTFNSTLAEEVSSAIASFLEQRPHQERYLAGYSLGGNFALRIAADDGTALALAAVVAICPPVDPAHAMVRIMAGPMYRDYFLDKWSGSLRNKLHYYPQLLAQGQLPRFELLTDLNDFFVAELTPFEDANAYFAAYALYGDRLNGLSVPAYLITSEDDPIVPVSDLRLLNRPASLKVEVTQFGGHCGFIENYRLDSWGDRCLTQVFNHHRNTPESALR